MRQGLFRSVAISFFFSSTSSFSRAISPSDIDWSSELSSEDELLQNKPQSQQSVLKVQFNSIFHKDYVVLVDKISSS